MANADTGSAMVSISKAVYSTDGRVGFVYIAGSNANIMHLSNNASLDGLDHFPSASDQYPGTSVLNATGLTVSGCSSTDSAVSQTVTVTCNMDLCVSDFAALNAGTLLSLPMDCGGGYFAIAEDVTQTSASAKQVTFGFNWTEATQTLSRRTAASSIDFIFKTQSVSFKSEKCTIDSKTLSCTNATISSGEVSFVHDFQQVLVGSGGLVNCSAAAGDASADCDISVSGTLNYTADADIIIVASVIPPKVSSVVASVYASGYVDVTASLSASAELSADTGSLTLLTLPIFGYSVPGLMTLGLVGTIDAEAAASINLDGSITVPLHFELPTISYVVGSADVDSSNGTITGKTTNNVNFRAPSDFCVNANAELGGNVKVQLGGTIAFEIDVLKKLLDAEIGVKADTFAELDSTVTAQNVNVTGYIVDLDVDAYIGATVDLYATLKTPWPLVQQSGDYPILDLKYPVLQKTVQLLNQSGLQSQCISLSSTSNILQTSSGSVGFDAVCLLSVLIISFGLSQFV
ncbi:hypothetical protein HDU84_004973 [Entophlyctis sp. JEL0112]|nr:hypothetical protein HDU84_004973 [Entophlyctis sp. JEL0112]